MNWFRQIFTRRRIYSDLSEEIEQHLVEKMEALMAGGMSREDAEHAAKREFGNVARIKERSREPWRRPTAESIFADVSFAIRKLRKSPGFSVTASMNSSRRIGTNLRARRQ